MAMTTHCYDSWNIQNHLFQRVMTSQGKNLTKAKATFSGGFTCLRKGWGWFHPLTDWLMNSQTKSLFYKEWRQFKEWDDNGHWCTKVRWRGEVDVNELENRGRSVSVCPLSAFAWMMCGPRIRMGTKTKFMEKVFYLVPALNSLLKV